VWTGFIWLRIRIAWRALVNTLMNFGCHLMLGSSWVAEQLATSLQRLNSFEWVHSILGRTKAMNNHGDAPGSWKCCKTFKAWLLFRTFKKPLGTICNTRKRGLKVNYILLVYFINVKCPKTKSVRCRFDSGTELCISMNWPKDLPHIHSHAVPKAESFTGIEKFRS
jgi:hypothetical protein